MEHGHKEVKGVESRGVEKSQRGERNTRGREVTPAGERWWRVSEGVHSEPYFLKKLTLTILNLRSHDQWTLFYTYISILSRRERERAPARHLGAVVAVIFGAGAGPVLELGLELELEAAAGCLGPCSLSP